MMTFVSFTISFCVPILAYLLYKKYKKSKLFWDKIDKIPGPPAIFLFGNTHKFKFDRVGFTLQLIDLLDKYGKNGIMRLWVGHVAVVCLCRCHTAETLLRSSKYIEKPVQYNFIKTWIGDGLLISGGDKWRFRRKVLTPAFHFSILNGYMEIFNRQSDILVKQLLPNARTDLHFNIFPYIGRCALDIICETAMGVLLNAQLNANSEYVQSVTKICEIITKQQRMPWLKIKPIFRVLYGRDYEKCLRILRQFVTKVIDDRIQERASANSNEQNCRKNRSAFLDLLLNMQEENKLTYEDIREEVDTFMLEGHDNTASSIGWAIFLLGHHPKVQKKIVEELDAIFENSDRSATADDLKRMKYLDCAIKESLRLYPPVVGFGRTVTKENLEIAGYEIPIGTTIFVAPTQIHYDPDIFGVDFKEFRPERFENRTFINDNPYAYVPFSAGPRNCIGQKFALMEEKIVLSSILRKYEITSIDSVEKNIGIPELVLRPLHGFNVRLTPRH